MKKRKLPKERNFAALELWSNPLFKPKKHLSEKEKQKKHDHWDRQAKYKSKDI